MTEAGKRVWWVELYLDLVFVLAIGALAHLIIAEPRMRTVWIVLGLFVALWWTWVGFAVLYNRHGADEPLQRLVYLPAGAAAVAIEPAFKGHGTAFTVSLAITRLLLAGAYARDDDPTSTRGDRVRVRTSRAFLMPAVLFVVSIWTPAPLR